MKQGFFKAPAKRTESLEEEPAMGGKQKGQRVKKNPHTQTKRFPLQLDS